MVNLCKIFMAKLFSRKISMVGKLWNFRTAVLIYFWSFFRSKGCYRHYGKWRYLDFSLRHVVFIWRTLGHLRKWAIDWPWGKAISRPRNCKENYHPWHFETLWHSVKFWEMFPNYSVKCFRFLCHSDFTWNQFQIF